MAACAVARSLRESTWRWAERRTRNLAPARRLRLRLAVDSIEHYAAGRPLRVLDAGCETGLLAIAVAERNPDWSVDAVDVNDASLEVARSWADEAGTTNLLLRRADVTTDLAPDTYDVVAAVECLAEIPDVSAALRGMARALRPGGMLFVHVPERRWRPVLPGSPTRWKNEVRHGFDAQELREAISGAGLEVVDVVPTTRALVHAAEELRGRIKGSSKRLLVLTVPAFAAAVALERHGVSWGEGRAWWAAARRP